jgi:hypothetical protein
MGRKIIMFIVVTFILITTYLVVDSNLYYYGKSKYNILENKLPLGLNPDYWGADISFPIVGLTIKDKYGIALIGKGCCFVKDKDTIRVEKIIKYGITPSKLIALIEANNKHNYFIECQSNPQLRVNIIDEDAEIKGQFKWIKVEDDKKKIADLVMLKTYSFLTIIISSIVFVVYLIRRLKKRLCTEK